jgi:sulfotransferase family protein
MKHAQSAGAITPAGDAAVVRRAGETTAGQPPGGSARATAGLVARPTQPAWERMARRTAHWGLVTAGRPAYRLRMLPSFIIVGAARCGTSSMFEVLRQHPAVFSAILPRKEVHYFDYKYQHRLSWYQCHFPLRPRAELAAHGAGVAPVAFEASPSYMHHPLAPARIHRDLPGVRLVVMLRDPVERAYSAHVMSVGRGYETEPFERALELEDSRLAGEAERLATDPAYVSYNHRYYSYRARGHYAEQLERLEQLFGRDRIHVIDSGDFFAGPEPVYHRLLDFLELPHIGHPVFERPRTRSRPPLPGSVRTALEEHYRPHDERLAAWLGYEPSWRR